jgi:N-acetylmuramoyl-L-alanine amidase
MSSSKIKLPVGGGIAKLKPEAVKFIAVHCSATSPKQDVGAVDIDRWHRMRGFIKIGYHYVIKRDGTVEVGRPITEVGAHIEDFNHCSIGICMVGGVDASKAMKPENNFTPEQFTALTKVLTQAKKDFPNAVIQGHRDFPKVAKACPSFDVKAWVADNTFI